MKLSGHLLYIDITQICGIGCSFCMYSDKHSSGISMTLSILAKENLSRLINSPDVKRISISGEGEPLNNYKVFHEILSLSKGGKSFEFITSGFFPHDKMEQFYIETNKIASSNGDTCNIRLSADSHHIEKVKWRAHGFSLDYFYREKPKALSFSFRSIDTDRKFTQDYLLSELARWGIHAGIEQKSTLEDRLKAGSFEFSIDYKNLVHPSPDAMPGYLDLNGYIKAIESKVDKPFTFGSLNKHPLPNGLDVTLKPDGRVFLYGIETQSLGNIHFDHIDWDGLTEYVRTNPLARNLYTKPLSLFLTKYENNILKEIASKANNPYWLVKGLIQDAALLEQWEGA